MTSGLCLSRDEVQELSRTPFKARQLAFLRQNGIRHYVDGHGWPVVLRAAVGADVEAPKAKVPEWEPRNR